MNGLSAKIPYFCARYLVKAGKANVLYMAGFCAFICLLNGLYCGRFRQSVIIIRAMLLVEINDVSPPPGWARHLPQRLLLLPQTQRFETQP